MPKKGTCKSLRIDGKPLDYGSIETIRGLEMVRTDWVYCIPGKSKNVSGASKGLEGRANDHARGPNEPLRGAPYNSVKLPCLWRPLVPCRVGLFVISVLTSCGFGQIPVEAP